MLGKLLKYDLKWMYKVLIIFYILAAIFAVIGRGLTSIENSIILNIVGQVCNGISISMMVSILMNNILRMWARFIKNVYKDESYLTHTLPVEKKTIYLSKILSAIITMFTSILVILICLAICYYSAENIEYIKGTLEIAAEAYNSTVVYLLLTVFAVFSLEMIFAVLAGYIGIIIGHKSNNNKTLKSVIYGFLAYIIPQAFTLLIIFIVGLFNTAVMNLFNTTDILSIDAIKTTMYVGMIIYVVYIVMYYLLGRTQLEKGVNVD